MQSSEDNVLLFLYVQHEQSGQHVHPTNKSFIRG